MDTNLKTKLKNAAVDALVNSMISFIQVFATTFSANMARQEPVNQNVKVTVTEKFDLERNR